MTKINPKHPEFKLQVLWEEYIKIKDLNKFKVKDKKYTYLRANVERNIPVSGQVASESQVNTALGVTERFEPKFNGATF